MATWRVEFLVEAGGGFTDIAEVDTYERVSETDIPDYLYRNEFTADVVLSHGDPLGSTTVGAVPDSMRATNVPPRQATKSRFAHVFRAADLTEVGFYWDDVVKGVKKLAMT